MLVGGEGSNGDSVSTAYGVERWLPSPTPWLSQQPSSQTAECGGDAQFSITVADGYSTGVGQWRRNGVPLANGTTPHGSTIIGVNGATLHVQNAKPEDAGTYDFVYSITCASVTSAAATLTVNGGCCPADINNDNAVNVTDLLAVIGAWGACANPNDCPADINADDLVNVTDLLAVIGAWGACP
jgi:hypothetical protein